MCRKSRQFNEKINAIIKKAILAIECKKIKLGDRFCGYLLTNIDGNYVLMDESLDCIICYLGKEETYE